MVEEKDETKSASSVSDAEDKESTAEFLEPIERRFRDGEFPAVFPKEQRNSLCADAADILTLVQKEEAVVVQSYIDEQYKKYRETCCCLLYTSPSPRD